jgi:putative oxidoreductase
MSVKVAAIAGRILLAALFILAGVAKITTPQPFLDHMAAHHIPAVLLPAVIALELGAGLAVCFANAFNAAWCTASLDVDGWPPQR